MKTAREKQSFANVMKNMNRQIASIKGGGHKGMLKAAVHVRNDMDKTPPLLPVDTGNLRQSWFISPLYSLNSLILGFSANYAFFVHENVGATFLRPGAGAKFFQASLNRNKQKILEIIREEAKV